MTRREQFEAALTHGYIVRGRYFVVRARPNGMTLARLGIIAGRKAIPRAVDRNRSKRTVREMFRSMKQRLVTLDVVVLCRDALPKGRQAAARQELGGLLVAIIGDPKRRPAPNRQ